MRQKKLFSMIGLCFVLISVVLSTSCSSMRPIQTTAQFPADGAKYVILGRVEYKGKLSGSGAGYTKLLEAAKTKYPNADDVVNIVVDAKCTTTLFGTKYHYVIMSGIAIDYLEVK